MGNLRFARPKKPAKPWEGTLQATRAPQPCFQPTAMGPFVFHEGQEDCLYLNVYVPHMEYKVNFLVKFAPGFYQFSLE